MILPPGKYEILVESDGYEELLENVEVLDKVHIVLLLKRTCLPQFKIDTCNIHYHWNNCGHFHMVLQQQGAKV